MGKVSTMSEFYLESTYQPSGDQPQAIEKLVASIKKEVATKPSSG